MCCYERAIGTVVHPRELSPETVVKYRGYVKTLLRKYSNEHPGGSVRDTPLMGLAEMLLRMAPDLRPKTFINYRCGLLYVLNMFPTTQTILDAARLLREGAPASGYKGHKRGVTATLYSSRSGRSRTFNRRAFGTLMAELSSRQGHADDRRRNHRASQLLIWLQAGLATGLRPVEWATACWASDKHEALLVQTAKTKRSYALPSLSTALAPKRRTRTVKVASDERFWVDTQLALIQRHLQSGKLFSAYYNNNRVYLWSLCRSVFGKSRPPFTLYLMRGQFASNRKRAGLTSEEVGVEIGCSGNVASTYYGNKAHGHRSVVKPARREKSKPTPQAGKGRRPSDHI
jgi:hypothetical protein